MAEPDTRPALEPADLAHVLEGFVPVLAADPIHGEPAVELVLEAEWDYLPRPVADVTYRHGYAPTEMGGRAPDYRYVILRQIGSV